MRHELNTSAPASLAPRRIFNRWLILVTIGLGITLGGMDNSLINATLPALADAFTVEADIILWLAVAFNLVTVGLALTWGSLGDAIGRRRVYLTGFIFFTLGLLVLTMSQSVAHLIAGRVVQAIGLSMIMANGLAIAVAAFPDKDRGKVIGLVGSFVGTGLVLGPILGGAILELLDWRALFYTRLPLGLLVMALAWVIIPHHRPSGERRPFDYLGAVTLFVLLASLLLVVNRSPQVGLLAPPILALGATSLIAGALFAVAELRAPMPVVNFSLLRSRFLSISVIVHFLTFLATVSIVFLLPFYLLNARGLPAAQMGGLLATLQVTRLFVAPMSGWLTDRLGARAVATSGIVLATLGISFLAQLDPASSLVEIILGLALAGTGSAIFDPANEASILRAVPQERLGSAAAMTTTARQTGFAVGIAITGTLYAARLRFHEAVLSAAPASLATPMQQAAALAYQEVLFGVLALMIPIAILSALRGSDRRVLAPSASAT